MPSKPAVHAGQAVRKSSVIGEMHDRLEAEAERVQRHERLTGERGVDPIRAAVQAVEAARAQGRIPTHLPLNALEALPYRGANGLAFQLGGDRVSGQRVAVRRIEHPSSGPGFEVSFKLRTGYLEELSRTMEQAGAHKAPFVKEEMQLGPTGALQLHPEMKGYSVMHANRHTPLLAQRLEKEGRFSVELLDEPEVYALLGTVRIRAYGEGSSATANLMEAVAKTGLAPALADSSPESRALLNQMRVLWQRAPAVAQALASSPAPLAEEEVAAALRAVKVDPDQAAALPVMEVYPGHFTTLNPGQAEEYEALGVKYLFAGMKGPERAASILAGEGLMSTLERFDRGLIIKGTSPTADLLSGGADYVFTRMVTERAKDVPFSSINEVGKIQLILSPRVLERTDWFAYPADRIGTTRPTERFLTRTYGQELVDSLWHEERNGKFTYLAENEVMFHGGIAAEYFQGATVQGRRTKQLLLDELTKRGVTEINGQPLSEAIRFNYDLL